MNNKIENPKTEVQSGLALNDKDYLQELLICLKEMIKNFATAETEASNEILYNKIKPMCEEIKTLQRKAYELTFKKGWYSLEKQDTQKINEKFNNLNQEFNNLEPNN